MNKVFAITVLSVLSKLKQPKHTFFPGQVMLLCMILKLYIFIWLSFFGKRYGFVFSLYWVSTGRALSTIAIFLRIQKLQFIYKL